MEHVKRADDDAEQQSDVGALPFLAVGTPPACGGEERRG
jgi:hypothetical protein